LFTPFEGGALKNAKSQVQGSDGAIASARRDVHISVSEVVDMASNNMKFNVRRSHTSTEERKVTEWELNGG
jgi:hypothetical protein